MVWDLTWVLVGHDLLQTKRDHLPNGWMVFVGVVVVVVGEAQNALEDSAVYLLKILYLCRRSRFDEPNLAPRLQWEELLAPVSLSAYQKDPENARVVEAVGMA